MDEEERQKLVKRRAKRLKEKELENDLQRDLGPKERKQIRTKRKINFRNEPSYF